jgi:hypothetical protein
MKADPRRKIMHAVGLRLGKTIGEIEAIPHREFVDWIAFFELTAEK